MTRSQWMLVAAVCLFVAASAAQSAADRPPGVDENSWIPLSEVAGILLTDVAGAPEAVRFQFPERNVQPLVPRRGTGILMVKYGGNWMRVDPEPPPARVQPLR